MGSPRYLYRVFDDQSVSKWDEDDGFIAGWPDRPFDPSRHGARKVVEEHMDWSNRTLTPFISATSSPQKAVQYARQREEMGRSGVFIAEIDATRGRLSIYHMQSLVRSTRAYVPPEGWNKYEYLILREIPTEAIISISTWDEGV